MRSIWKGSIAFGLVNVPVKVYSATEDHDIKFHQVHAKDNGRIRYKRTCEVCGEVVEYRDIAKAFESDDGQMVVITDEDIATLPEERSREIEVLEFVPASDLDPLMYDRSYFLEPDGKSSKSYVLLAKTLSETDRVAIVHFALRNKTRLAALRVKDFSKRDVMMIHTLLWPDEIRDPDFPVLDKEVEIKPAELKMAGQVVESMTDDFNADFTGSLIESNGPIAVFTGSEASDAPFFSKLSSTRNFASLNGIVARSSRSSSSACARKTPTCSCAWKSSSA